MEPVKIFIRTQNTRLNTQWRKILTFPYLNFIGSSLSSQIVIIESRNTCGSLFHSSSLWFHSSSLWLYTLTLWLYNSSLWLNSQINIRVNLRINFLNFNLFRN